MNSFGACGNGVSGGHGRGLTGGVRHRTNQRVTGGPRAAGAGMRVRQ